jgi:hypothetical protein
MRKVKVRPFLMNEMFCLNLSVEEFKYDDSQMSYKRLCLEPVSTPLHQAQRHWASNLHSGNTEFM